MATIIVRGAKAFDPNTILRTESKELRRKVKRLMQKLVSLKIIAFKTGDSALTQYSNFLENEVTPPKELFLSFNRKNCRLDDFFFKNTNVEQKFSALDLVLKIIFSMSHGQASVERGFNDNNAVLHHNMAAGSAIGRRFVKNYMSVNGLESYTVPITPQFLKSAKCARRRYEVHLEDMTKSHQKEENRVDAVLVFCSKRYYSKFGF